MDLLLVLRFHRRHPGVDSWSILRLEVMLFTVSIYDFVYSICTALLGYNLCCDSNTLKSQVTLTQVVANDAPPEN